MVRTRVRLGGTCPVASAQATNEQVEASRNVSGVAAGWLVPASGWEGRAPPRPRRQRMSKMECREMPHACVQDPVARDANSFITDGG